MNTPVVFVHWKENEYLNMAVKQASKYNDVRLILNPRMVGYSMEVDRWFVLRDYMSKASINRCLYLDSDVLLYKDVSKDFTDCDLAFSKGHSGHTMFINNLRALDDFCLYIESNYFMGNHKDMIDRTRQWFPEGQFANALGDMVLLNNFMLDNRGNFFCDTSKIRNDSVYDHNINTDGVPLVIGNIKYRIAENGNHIRMNSLHFQGDAKKDMRQFLDHE